MPPLPFPHEQYYDTLDHQRLDVLKATSWEYDLYLRAVKEFSYLFHPPAERRRKEQVTSPLEWLHGKADQKQVGSSPIRPFRGSLQDRLLDSPVGEALWDLQRRYNRRRQAHAQGDDGSDGDRPMDALIDDHSDVRHLLARISFEHGFTCDAELAEHLGRSKSSLSRVLGGERGKALAALTQDLARQGAIPTYRRYRPLLNIRQTGWAGFEPSKRDYALFTLATAVGWLLAQPTNYGKKLADELTKSVLSELYSVPPAGNETYLNSISGSFMDCGAASIKRFTYNVTSTNSDAWIPPSVWRKLELTANQIPSISKNSSINPRPLDSENIDSKVLSSQRLDKAIESTILSIESTRSRMKELVPSKELVQA